MGKMITKRELKVVLQQLIEMQQEAMSINPPMLGICTSLDDRIMKLGETDARWYKWENRSAVSRWLKSTFGTWDEFSGCYTYPIKPTGCAAPGSEYFQAGNDGTRWSLHTGYGRARHRLLSHIIACAAAEVCAVRTRTENQQRNG